MEIRGRFARRGNRPERRAASIVLALAFTFACSGGGGGGGGGDGPSDGPGEVALQSASVRWGAASGPVAGYRVAVSRDDQPFRHEQSVPQPRATIRGEVGEVVRIRVAAYDIHGNMGPESLPSDPIQFTPDAPQVTNPDPLPEEPENETPPGAPPGDGAPGEGGGTPPAETPTEPGDPEPPSEEPTTPETGEPEETEPEPEEGDLAVQVVLAPRLDAAAPPIATLDALASGWDVVAAADLDGNGLADPIWIGPSGIVAATWMYGPFVRPLFRAIGIRDDGWALVALEDLDGDGRDDFLWRDPASGALEVWGLVAETLQPIALPLAETAGSDVQVGDFDGDGRADLLLVDAATGATRLRSTGTSGELLEQSLVLPVAVGSVRVAAGDFDGDGRSDLLWRDPQGSLSISFMAGGQVESLLELADSAGLEILETADFDADGADEVVFRDPSTGSLGAVGVASRIGPAEWIEPLEAPAGGDLVAAGDFDGDGGADLAWSRAVAR